jgi:hypothetical protein
VTRIRLGASPAGPVDIDLDILLRTRLLVQASSGGGKSWLLRRLTEQLFGSVQVIVIDPEGEFATLRERYGYVLAGKGGETPADRRSAALLAHRLLELKASAVCDLYEMPPRERHAWVRLFLEALIDAPKKYWHGLVVIVDEAHVFAPEKGAGESEASDAMIGLATRGRKRGYCPIFATQRLGKLRKDAAAELLNVLIGQTFIDVDRKRAAEALGIAHGEQRAFFDELRLLKPGKFWALGRAITTERTLVTVGPVATTHPEAGSSKHSAEPPPPPDKVKALLPKLADLPAESEAKAKSEQELRAEIAQLKRERAEAMRSVPATPAAKAKRVEVPTIEGAKLVRLDATLSGLAFKVDSLSEKVNAAADMLKQWRTLHDTKVAKYASEQVTIFHPSTPAPAVQGGRDRRSLPVQRATSASTNGHDKLPRAERRILAALAQYPTGRTKTQVAILTGYAHSGGGFNNALSALRSGGLIDGSGDALRIMDAGVDALGHFEPLPTGDALLDHWRSQLGKAERIALDVLAAVYPRGMSKEELAEHARYAPDGGGFNNALSRLRTLELITGRGELRASQDLFD